MATAAKSEDEYDLGNTEMEFPPKEVPEDRPRNPDGTFAPRKSTPEAVSAEAAGGTGQPPPLAPKHPAYVIDAAAYFGFSEDDLADMTTEQVSRLVFKMQRERDKWRDEESRARLLSDTQARTPEPQPQLPPEEIFDLGIDEAQYDPGLVAAMKKIGLQSQKRIKELEEQLGQVHRREQARSASEQDRLIDGLFEKLGPDYEGIFGKGPIDALPRDSEDRLRRVAVVSVARNGDPKGFAERLVRAATRLFSPPAPKTPQSQYLEPAKPPVTPEQWNGGALARPTQRKTQEVKGDALAIRNLEARFREAGINTSAVPDAEEMDGFLD